MKLGLCSQGGDPLGGCTVGGEERGGWLSMVKLVAGVQVET